MTEEKLPGAVTGTTQTGSATRQRASGRDAPGESAQRQQIVQARPPKFDFAAFEPKWRARWEEQELYQVDLRHAKRPYYNLMMFPYPSAEGLHVGNVYSYIGSDVHGRWKAMQGYDVFEPMGFDAFGIHSENFAIKRRIHPRILTARNVERFREEQLKRIGNRFDWSHELHTAIAALMEYLNVLVTGQDVTREELQALLLLLAPFAPYLAEELWERMGNSGSIHVASWPIYDPEALRMDVISLFVQVNGRVRDRIEVPHDASEEEIRQQALASEKVQRFVAGQEVSRVIYVPGRLVNVVVA